MIQDMKPQEIDELLFDAPFGRLALADGEEPYIVPLSYVFANKAMYFHSWHEGKKIEIMRSNPKVCFEVDEYEGDINKWRSIILSGIAEEVNDYNEKIMVMQAFFKKYGMPDVNTHGLMTKKIGKDVDSITHANFQEVMEKIPFKIIRISIKEITGKKKQ